MNVRNLDHLVISVAGLDAARRRFGDLGFTVAPEGVHPFGTINACVYFADGTMVEPLTIGDAATVEAAAAEGNSFVLGDRRFRESRGGEGLSGLVFTTEDADADHAEFTRRGLSGGSMVAFSRPFTDKDGKADIASFLLAFAAPQGGADAYFFNCERRKVPAVDRSALERHENGATRIAAVEAEAADPELFAGFLAEIARAAPTKEDGFYEVGLPNVTLRVRENAALAAPRLTGIVFGVHSLAQTLTLLKARGVAFEERHGRLHVPAASGQGAAFTFEETS